MIGAILYTLAGALFLALRDIFGRLAMRGIDLIMGTAATAVAGQLILGIMSALHGDFAHPWPGWSWSLLNISISGILRITIARTLLFSAVTFIGAARGSSLASMNIFFALLLGLVFLEETLTLPLLCGAILIFAGCLLISRSQPETVQAKTARQMIIGLSLALGSAFAFGASSAFARTAINSFASPILANFYANAIALFTYTPLMWKRLVQEIGTWSRRTWVFIILTGLVVSLGTTAIYFVLAKASVVVVQPLSQTRTLFVVLIAWLFLQKHESVNWRVVVGAVLIVSGTIEIMLLNS